MPLVSVIIITFRRATLVRRAIASALAQTMSDIEVVIVVESEDSATVAALDEVEDTRLRYVVNPERRGPAAARDFGVNASLGLWIAFLDDDDEWLPDKLAKQIATTPDTTSTISVTLSRVVTPNSVSIRPTDPYEGTEPIDEWLFDRRSWFKPGVSYLQTSTLMIPRALFDRIRFGDARHEEWEIVIRAVKQFGFRLVTVVEPLVIYYAGNTTYPWRPSVAWIESMREVVTPRAYSGFCLTIATQGLDSPDRNLAFYTLLRLAFTDGSPTLRQVFAFILIWLIPDSFRKRVRKAFSKEN